MRTMLRRLKSAMTLCAYIGLVASLALPGTKQAIGLTCSGSVVNNCNGPEWHGCVIQHDCPSVNFCLEDPYTAKCSTLLRDFTCTIDYAWVLCYSKNNYLVGCTICSAPYNNGCCYTLTGQPYCPGEDCC